MSQSSETSVIAAWSLATFYQLKGNKKILGSMSNDY